MRFHCDRCKTRYAIADERVRGKILKIRCKNCSAVITVREGMSDGEASAPREASGAHRRVERQSGPVASPASQKRPSSQRLATEASSPRAVATRAASARPATGDDEVEWYISLEGESNGPFSLEDAREWIAGRHSSDELFCWHSGFDDWLPVEQVDSFHGLRQRMPSHTALTPQPDIVPDIGVGIGPAAGVDVGVSSRGPSRSAAGPFAASAASAGASTALGADGPVVPSAGLAAHQEHGSASLFDAGPGRSSPSSGKANGESSLPAGVAAKAGENGDRVASLSSDAFEAAAASIGDGSDDLDFEIGEPSRIVKLPMLMAQANAAGSAATSTDPAALPGMAARPAAIGRGTGSDPIIARATGSMAIPSVSSDAAGESLSDGADEELLRPETRRRSTVPLILAALGVAGISVAVLAFFVLSKSGDAGNSSGARRSMPSNLEELGFRHDNPVTRPSDPKIDGPASGKTDPVKKVRTRPKNNGNGQQTRTTNPGKSTGSGTGRFVPGQNSNDASRPLGPDEIQRMATKSQSGFVRCYERAKRKDPFLEVKSLRVTLTVGRDGRVAKVVLSRHSNSFLGTCLKGAVGRWSFRESKAGITTEISLKFE